MANTVRIRNGMSNATEGDILGNFGDLVGVGVVDKANGHLLVTQDSPVGMSIQVAGGIVYVPNASYNQLDSDTPKFYPVVCTGESLTIDNNVSGQTRNDIVCIKVDKSIFPDADASNIATKVVVKGTAGGGVPTTPANHYKLANIVVVNGETEITNAEITDTREQVLIEAETVDSIINNIVDNKTSGLLDWFYPVGTIYETTSTNLDTTTKMNAHFGGTWEAYGSGRVLVAKSSDTKFDTIGETGGAKTHTHRQGGPASDSSGSSGGAISGPWNDGTFGRSSSGVTYGNYSQIVSSGIGSSKTVYPFLTESTSSLQPYIVVYRYRRTA